MNESIFQVLLESTSAFPSTNSQTCPHWTMLGTVLLSWRSPPHLDPFLLTAVLCLGPLQKIVSTLGSQVYNVAGVNCLCLLLQGGGFKINRPFPTRALDQFDPWLMLDEMGPVEYGPGEAKGECIQDCLATSRFGPLRKPPSDATGASPAVSAAMVETRVPLPAAISGSRRIGGRNPRVVRYCRI
jgi:hypothetical protein